MNEQDVWEFDVKRAQLLVEELLRKLTREGDSKLHDLAARLFKERQDDKEGKVICR